MLILVSPNKIDVPPGAVIRVPATWQEYQTVANQRGDGSVPRIKYRQIAYQQSTSQAICQLRQQFPA